MRSMAGRYHRRPTHGSPLAGASAYAPDMADGAIDGGVRHTHYRSCNLCEAMCGVAIEHDGERVLAIRGDERDPFSRGYICPKATGLRAIHEDPDRLRTPCAASAIASSRSRGRRRTRRRHGGLLGVQEKHGKDAVGIYPRQPERAQRPARCSTARCSSAACARRIASRPRAWTSSRILAAAYEMFGHQLLLPIPDVGPNRPLRHLRREPARVEWLDHERPGDAQPARGDSGSAAVRSSSSIRATPETARAATEYHAIRPGTDAMVMMAILHGALPRRASSVWATSAHGWDGVSAPSAKRPARSLRNVSHPRAASMRRSSSRSRGSSARRSAPRSTRGWARARSASGGVAAWLTNANSTPSPGTSIPEGGPDDHASGHRYHRRGLRLRGSARGSFGRWKSRVRGYPGVRRRAPGGDAGRRTTDERRGADPGDGHHGRQPDPLDPERAEARRRVRGPRLLRRDRPLSERDDATREYHPPAPAPRSSTRTTTWHFTSWRCAIRRKFGPRPLRASRGVSQKMAPSCFNCSRPSRPSDTGHCRSSASSFAPLRAVGPRTGPSISGPAHRSLWQAPGQRARAKLDLATLRRKEAWRRPRAAASWPARSHAEARGSTSRPLATWRTSRASRAALDESQDTLLLIGRRQLRSNNSWLHNAPQLTRGKRRCTLMMNPDDAARAKVSDGERVFVPLPHRRGPRSRSRSPDAMMPRRGLTSARLRPRQEPRPAPRSRARIRA